MPRAGTPAGKPRTPVRIIYEPRIPISPPGVLMQDESKTEDVFDAILGATEEYTLVCRELTSQARRLAPLPTTPQLLRDADFAVSRVRATLFNALDANKRGDPDDAVIGFGKAATAQAAQAHEIIQRLHNIHVAEQHVKLYANPSPAVPGTAVNPPKELPVV